MNRILVTALAIALFLAVGAFAGMPFDKGNMYIAGGLSFTKYGGDLYKQGEDTPTYMSIYPEFYYFLRNSLAVGGNLGYSKYSIGDESTADFEFGIGAKYYFMMDKTLTEAKGAIFPYAAARFMLVNSKYDNGITENKESGHDIDFAGGGLYMLSNCVGAFGEVDFSLNSRKPDGGDSASGSQFGVLIGITYFICK